MTTLMIDHNKSDITQDKDTVVDITSIVVLAAAWPGFGFGLLPELPVTRR